MTRASTGVAGLGLGPPVAGGVAQRGEVALEVHADDRVPLLLASVDEHPVAQEAGVVDEDVEPAEGVDRRCGPGRCAPSQSATSSPLATASPAARLDLVDHLVGGPRCGRPSPSSATPKSLTTTRAPCAGERQRVGPADPAARAGDDDDASVADAGHGAPFACCGSAGCAAIAASTTARKTGCSPPPCTPRAPVTAPPGRGRGTRHAPDVLRRRPAGPSGTVAATRGEAGLVAVVLVGLLGARRARRRRC